MRFILTALIWLVVIGGLSFYIHQRDARIIPQAQAQISVAMTAADYLLEVTPTFGAEVDPFALLDEGQAPATLLVRLGGQNLYRGEEPLARGEILQIEPVSGLVEGNNELYFEASPPFEEAHLNHALRVRLLRGGVVQLDQTLWAEAGGKVSGTVLFQLEPSAEAGNDH
ncbi:MAG TPA: hypothetical protein VIR78_00595 [Malonomonas sp.]